MMHSFVFNFRAATVFGKQLIVFVCLCSCFFFFLLTRPSNSRSRSRSNDNDNTSDADNGNDEDYEIENDESSENIGENLSVYCGQILKQKNSKNKDVDQQQAL